MKIAEKLYTQGLISYPRTETNIFPKEAAGATAAQRPRLGRSVTRAGKVSEPGLGWLVQVNGPGWEAGGGWRSSVKSGAWMGSWTVCRCVGKMLLSEETKLETNLVRNVDWYKIWTSWVVRHMKDSMGYACRLCHAFCLFFFSVDVSGV